MASMGILQTVVRGPSELVVPLARLLDVDRPPSYTPDDHIDKISVPRTVSKPVVPVHSSFSMPIPPMSSHVLVFRRFCLRVVAVVAGATHLPVFLTVSKTTRRAVRQVTCAWRRMQWYAGWPSDQTGTAVAVCEFGMEDRKILPLSFESPKSAFVALLHLRQYFLWIDQISASPHFCHVASRFPNS